MITEQSSNDIFESRRVRLSFVDRQLLLQIGDFGCVTAAVFIGLTTWTLVAKQSFSLQFLLTNLIWFPTLSAGWFLLANASEFYDLSKVRSRTEVIRRLLGVTSQMVLIYLIIFFMSPADTLPRLFIFYYAITSFTLIALWHLSALRFIDLTTDPRNVVIYGSGEALDILQHIIRGRLRGMYNLTDVIDDTRGASELAMYLHPQAAISEIVIASKRNLTAGEIDLLVRAYECGIAIVTMPLFYEQILRRVPVDHIYSSWMTIIPTGSSSFLELYPLIRRGVDIVLALCAGLVFIVLFPFLALAIKLNSPGSIFYSQERLGLNGKVFRIYKLRTMIEDAEKETGPTFATESDPRATRVGKFLRKSRLDELPQFINILRGEMAVIGPRPERPEHIERLAEQIPFYRTRLAVLPGLTGWAQVNYRYGADDEDAKIKLEYDLYYIRHANLLLDMIILLKTIKKVLTMSGQ